MSAVILFTPVLTISGQAYMVPVFLRDAAHFLKAEFAFAAHRDNISLFQIISVGQNVFSVHKYLPPFDQRNDAASGGGKGQRDDAVQSSLTEETVPVTFSVFREGSSSSVFRSWGTTLV